MFPPKELIICKIYLALFFGGPAANEDVRDEVLCPKLHEACGQANEQTVFAQVQPSTQAQGHPFPPMSLMHGGNSSHPRGSCRAWGGDGEAADKAPGYIPHGHLWRSGLP